MADSTEAFDSADPAMSRAIETAKSSFREFLSTFFNPAPGQKSFLVKVALSAGEEVEHIWLADLELVLPRFRGVIANEPKTRSLSFKLNVSFDPAQITDWMYIDNGRLVGGFTTRVIRDRMSPKERAELDADSPYMF